MDSEARRLVLALAVAGTLLTAWFVVLGAPPTSSDHAWYRGPAAALVTDGRLAIPGLEGMFPRATEVSAVYPQLGQLGIAAFYAVFGFSRRATIACDMLAHTLAAMGIALTSLRLTRGFEVERRAAWVAALATGLVWLAAHRTLDRLEHFGLLLVWLDLAILPIRAFDVKRAALSGVLAGLAALCAPWAGVLAGGVIATRAVAHAWDGTVGGLARSAPPILAGAVPTVGLFAAWVFAMEAAWPGIVDEQFFGAMRAAARYEGDTWTLPARLSMAMRNLAVEATVAPGLLMSALWLPIAMRELPRAEGEDAAAARRLAIALNAAGIGACVVGSLWRPTTYFYFWASAQLALPALVLVYLRFLRSGGLGRVVVVGITAVAWYAVVVTSWYALRADPRERLDGAQQALHAIVPPGVPVATTTTHWFAFQGRNPWVDLTALYKYDMHPGLVADFDWLVLGNGKGQNLPDAIIDQFERVDGVDTEIPVQVTYAWVVYRRVRPAEGHAR